MRDHVRKECDSIAATQLSPNPATLITTLHARNESLTGPFRCCAIVGSSTILEGRGLGAEIDFFDTVIRVNRLPTQERYRDFGAKTDIAFVNDQFWFVPTIPLLGTDDRLNCSLPGVCNFSVVLSSWQPWPARDWPKAAEAWKQTNLRVGHEEDEVGDGLRAYLPKRPPGKEHYMPSNGFHAFFTFAPQCSYTRLYGFGGPQTTSDGHVVSDFHNFSAELRIIKMIGRGDHAKLKGIHKKAKRRWLDLSPGWLLPRLKELKGRVKITD